MKKQISKIIREYVLSVVEDGLNGEELTTDQEKIAYLKERFYSEYQWNIDRLGKIKACREWLLGLALNVDYTYFDIEQKLKEWGIIDGSETDLVLDKELDMYWDRLASAVVYMIDREHK